MLQKSSMCITLTCAAVFATAFLSACGGGDGVPVSQDPTLQSIAISPGSAQLYLGTSQQFIATGTLTDGSTRDLSESVQWASNDSSVMLLNNSVGRVGVGNTCGPGTASISASDGTLTGTTTVTVIRRTPAFLYAANMVTSSISGFAVDPASGSLTAVPGSPYPCPAGNPTIAVTRDFQFLYAADFPLNQISAFSVGGDGSLASLPGTPFPAGHGPVCVVTHPTADFLYATNQGSGEVTTYSIAPELLSESSVEIGFAPLYAAMTPDGAYFYQAVSSLVQINGYSVDAADGSLTEVSGSPFPTGTYPRSIAVDPAGKFLYVAIASSTLVYAYAIDATTGNLTAVAGSPFESGDNPVSAAVDVSGRFLYVANNANSATGNSVSAFSIDPESGVLTAVPGSPFAASPFPLSVATDPSGQYVYVGLDSSPGIAAFVMDQVTGALTPMAGSPFPGSSVWSIVTTH